MTNKYNPPLLVKALQLPRRQHPPDTFIRHCLTPDKEHPDKKHLVRCGYDWRLAELHGYQQLPRQQQQASKGPIDPEDYAPPPEEGDSVIPPRKPLLEYGDAPPAPENTLLGARFLCREGGMLLVGPSGIGKSAASIQQDILWSIGEPAFGIQPARPLKIIGIQAEDDEGDLSEFVSGVKANLKLTPAQDALCRANCAYYCHKDFTGHRFLQEYLRPLLARDRPDIVRLNPLQVT